MHKLINETELLDFSEEVLANLVHGSIALGELKLAQTLLSSELTLSIWERHEEGHIAFTACLSVPRISFDEMNEQARYLKDEIDALLKKEGYVRSLEIGVRRVSVGENWREDISKIVLGFGEVNNQGRVNSINLPKHMHNGMLFRSKTEIVICKELENRNLLFFPLPVGNILGAKKEPDFLIFSKGKAGILEVMGDRYHAPENAAQDHERGRWFERQGIQTHFYDARRCYNEPKAVVDEMLAFIEQRVH